MNTERPDNDDAARGPEDGRAPQDRGTPREARAEETSSEENTENTESGESGKAEEDGGTGAGESVSRAGPGASADVPGPAREAGSPGTSGATDAEEPAAGPVADDGAPATPAPPADPAAPGPRDEAEDGVVARSPGVERHADERHGGAAAGGRRRSVALVASVAAAVLLVGGGGAYLASRAGDGAGGGRVPAADGTPPALVLDDHAPASDPESPQGIAPGEPNPYGVVYRADGTLPAGPGSAPVYWAKGEVARAEVARLADALGVEGTAVAEGRTWRVGSAKDGSGPVLRVERDAPGAWTFSRYVPGTDSCKSGSDVCAPDATASSADPVGEAAARKAAAPVLKAVGQGTAEIDASQVMGAQRVVNADPEIDGLPTYGWTTGVTVSAQGEIVAGSGKVKAPAEGATYPVLGARETLDRMNAAPGADPRAGIGGCATPVPAEEQPQGACGTSSGVSHKETLTVEEAVFGLAPHASGGRQVLVPSWLFSVRGAGAGGAYTVTHPAVEPRFLSAPPAATPSGAPTPDTGTRDVKVDGYTAEGDELVVAFTGGVCSDYRVTAVESGDRVKVTVTETPWPDTICIKVAKFFHRTVRLDEPLGDRTVVGSDGKQVPLEKPGARLPR
ncbi:hypothetical protein ACIRPQ_20285 [Streptomyces sp. NPDC101213]|uniref:hypothetical protein n=1 Tax=Streptomyces sp. NPDC101213 TaxID=3366130 RepID=UPI0038284F91